MQKKFRLDAPTYRKVCIPDFEWSKLKLQALGILVQCSDEDRDDWKSTKQSFAFPALDHPRFVETNRCFLLDSSLFIALLCTFTDWVTDVVEI